jgi:hypothetical protein
MQVHLQKVPNKQKNVEKTLIFLTFCQSLTKKARGFESGSVSQWYGPADPDPDPYQYGLQDANKKLLITF